jgi:hypothetical protein
MTIKVSTLLAHNTKVVLDLAPSLGGPLNTNNFPIVNGGNPVTITGNEYPINTGAAGQVLTTNGFGTLSWTTNGVGSVTSVGLTSTASTITVSGLPNPITASGTFNVDLPLSGVTANTYGSASSVSVFAVNSRGIVTSASNSPISITPAQAGLGNVTNALQVINAGGNPSMQQGTGIPAPPSNLGAVYIDRAVTNGNGIYYYDGVAWQVIAQKLNLYNEKSSVFTAPIASGTNSIALGEGSHTTSTASDSLAIGQYSVARIQGGVVQASGRFSTNGDAQAGRYLLRGMTITGPPPGPSPVPVWVELFVDGTGGSVRLILLDNSAWTFKITVTAHRQDLDNGRAGYTAAGVIYRTSGAASTAIQGSVNKVVLAESNPAWDINIDADVANGSLRVRVTGEAAKQIRWVALVETVEITN